MTQETKKITGIIALTLSITFFVLGMYFPLLSIHTQIIWEFGYEEITVFKSAQLFYESKEYLLATVIVFFTVVIPVVEFSALTVRIFNSRTNRFLQHLDKWNMLDVFLVALLLLNFKMQSNIIVMRLKTGTTFVALSVIFRILAVIFIASDNKIKHDKIKTENHLTA